MGARRCTTATSLSPRQELAIQQGRAGHRFRTIQVSEQCLATAEFFQRVIIRPLRCRASVNLVLLFLLREC